MSAEDEDPNSSQDPVLIAIYSAVKGGDDEIAKLHKHSKSGGICLDDVKRVSTKMKLREGARAALREPP